MGIGSAGTLRAALWRRVRPRRRPGARITHRAVAWLFAGALVATGGGAGPAAAEAPAAGDVIDAMHAGFVDVLKRAPELGFEGRVEALGPIVDGAYDLSFMAIKSLGSGASELTEADRRRWVESFGAFITSDYARRFESYTGQRFERVGERAAPRDQVIVETQVVRADGETVKLDYRLRETPAGWRIIDIYARGSSSLLSARRAEFSSFLAEKGIDALIASVDARGAAE